MSQSIPIQTTLGSSKQSQAKPGQAKLSQARDNQTKSNPQAKPYFTEEPDVHVLETLFNDAFLQHENTRLVSGAEEPLYLPASETGEYCEIRSTNDYFRSALHEISHWCVAGEERRKLVDFGYWYEPDGRSEEQQREFEKVEVKPQAMEWLFTEACRVRFRLSVDNVNNPEAGASDDFVQNVAQQAQLYLHNGLPQRGQLFLEVLMNYFDSSLTPDRFTADRLK